MFNIPAHRNIKAYIDFKYKEIKENEYRDDSGKRFNAVFKER